jgi:hypothetical protein
MTPATGAVAFDTGAVLCVAVFVTGAAAFDTGALAAGGAAFETGAGALGVLGLLAGALLPLLGVTALLTGAVACSTAEEAGFAAPSAPPIGLDAAAGADHTAAPRRPTSAPRSVREKIGRDDCL